MLGPVAWLVALAIIMIGYALWLWGRDLIDRRQHRDLFHDSHRPGDADPEPVKIDWDAMRNRKVGR